MKAPVIVVGAGLAGCEAAWQLARAGIETVLYEMKPLRYSPAHHHPGFAELVCSNSLKAERLASAAGLLKEEMRRMGSLLVPCALQCRVPAGGALAVDRDQFSAMVTEAIRKEPLIHVETCELTEIPQNDLVILATGPLTSDVLAEKISEMCGGSLHFFDAAAPVVTAESLNRDRIFAASRYDRGDDAAYLNCPMNKAEYEQFLSALLSAERAPLHAFETEERPVYEGCMPVEILASRGTDALRYGPMKPVGLRDPKTGHRPWAVLQLRMENAAGDALQFGRISDQPQIRRTETGIWDDSRIGAGEYMRYGVMHRNTFLDSPVAACRFQPAGTSGSVFCRADDRRGGLYGVGGLRAARRTGGCGKISSQKADFTAAGDDDGCTFPICFFERGEVISADGSKFRNFTAAFCDHPEQTGTLCCFGGPRTAVPFGRNAGGKDGK